MCAHPKCGKLTFGPSLNTEKSTNIGIAAHIKAATSGGPRYDKKQSREERRSPENGIWMCSVHAKLIDDDVEKFSVEMLREWKGLAENRAEYAQDNPALVTKSADYSNTSLSLFREFPNKYRRAIFEGQGLQKISISPLFGDLGKFEASVPLTFGDNIPKGHSSINVLCENRGLGIDKDIIFRVELLNIGIVKCTITEPSRVKLISGGKNNATFAQFTIPTLLPDECQSVILLIREPNTFIANITSFASQNLPRVAGFDITLHKPIPNTPKANLGPRPFVGNIPKKTVTCDLHGIQPPRRVCQHIASEILSRDNIGFNIDIADPGEFYDAWCDRCDNILKLYDNKWLPEMMPLVKPSFVCSQCYDNKKELSKSAL